MDINKFDMTLDEAISVMKEIFPDVEETTSRRAEKLILNAVHYGEMVNKHSFCDFVRDWMSKKLDPTAIRPEEMTHKMLYRSWVELWWMLDHYFEHDSPKWGDEKDGE